jgi:putative colanic acid biosysnthesis UDP-glucose lipid carrier transferase
MTVERELLKIYPQGLVADLSGTRPWHWSLLIKYAMDPVVAVAAYLAVLWAYREPLIEPDVAVLALALALLVPTQVPFRVFNTRIALSLLGLWARVVFGVGGLWIAIDLFDLRLGVDREITTWWLAVAPAAMLVLHWATPKIVPRLASFYPHRKVIMVGANSVAQRVAESIARREREGQHFVGYFDDRSLDRLASFPPHQLMGRLADVSSFVKSQGIDAIYISLPLATQPRLISLLQALADTTASIYFLPDIFVADPIQARVTTEAGLPVVSVCESPFDGPAGAIKRVFDLTLTLGALPMLIPLVLAIAVLIRVTSPGPVFFAQRRYGLDGKQILVFKFRTMSTVEDGEKTYTQVARGDSRVTPVGHFLRKTSLDELPQLFNVLCGTMSLVGPRPHALAVNEQYRKLIPRYMVRHKVRPGISGWAQVNGCRGGDDLESMRRRTEYDLAYLRTWSLSLDVLIVWKTLKLLIAGDERAY